MDLTNWILENMVSCLIIRMDLARLELRGSRPGAEGVQASIVGYHYDDDGPVMANISYDCSEHVDVGRMTVKYDANSDRFEGMASAVSSVWSSDHTDWASRADKLFFYVTPSKVQTSRPYRRHLSSGNFLVLQHLARIQGLVVANAGSTPDQRAVMHTTARRLSSLIQQGNAELMKLTQLH